MEAGDTFASHSAVIAGQDKMITQLREQVEAQEAKINRLYRELAAERLRADRGWERWASANSDRNDLRAERAKLMNKYPNLFPVTP